MPKRTWFTAAAAAGGKTADIAIYDEIGAWGVTAADFRNALQALGPVEAINLRLNSPGGDVFAGVAIHNMLARHPATVNVTVDGIAASIASLVAMAGAVTMPENAMMFVHNPVGFAMGDAADMAEMSDALGKIGTAMAATYARKTGQSPDEMLAVMNASTWMTAQEAKDMGFADAVAPPAQIAARFDLRRFEPPAEISARLQAAYDPDGDGDDDALEAVGYINAAIADLTDAIGALTGTGDSDDETMSQAVKAARASRQLAERRRTPDPSGAPADAEEIASLCLLAGMPDKTFDFLRSRKSPAEVRSALQALRADRGRGAADEISARHNPTAGQEDAVAGWAKTIENINRRVG
jgi:ATP-dependent Clp protease protease subunit